MSSVPDGRPALFLDRDGVINVERHYVHRIEDFEFMPGIFELCATALTRGYLLIVVTNQAGIARGFYTEDDYLRLTEWMQARFLEQGIPIKKVYHCPHHPSAGLGVYGRDCDCRKPKPGMLLQAAHDCQIDLSRSLLIGDKISDLEAGRRAGIGGLVLRSSDPPGDPGLMDVLCVGSLHEARGFLFGQWDP
jgi:D-glycero-D-manno-heptose 1,7-bisphosphate phosphatase